MRLAAPARSLLGWLLGLLLLVGAFGRCGPAGNVEHESSPGPTETHEKLAAAPQSDCPLAWYSWSAEAFAAAAAADAPVLLYLAAPGWDGVFAEESSALKQLVETAYVPVRVDPFERPDLARRYAFGGWPAIAVLMPDGRSFAAAVALPARHTRLYLLRLLQAYRTRRPLLEQKIAAATRAPGTARYRLDLQAVYRDCAAAFDTSHAGFGAGAKFLEPLTLAFLQDYARARADASAQQMVERTLAALASSAMLDRGTGGVHPFTFTPDWRLPAPERDAADQALLLQFLLDRPARRDADTHGMARGLLRYVREELYDARTGAFRGRQIRAPDGSWWTDPRVYADRHALLVRMVAAAAVRYEDVGLGEIARRSAAYLLEACMDSTGEVRHLCQGGGPTGLLADQALAGLALLETAALNPDSRWQRGAQNAAAYMRAHLGGAGAAFRDRPAHMELPQLPAPPVFPYMDGALPAGNALAAELLAALGDGQHARAIVEEALLQHPPSRVHSSMGRVLLALSTSEP